MKEKREYENDYGENRMVILNEMENMCMCVYSIFYCYEIIRIERIRRHNSNCIFVSVYNVHAEQDVYACRQRALSGFPCREEQHNKRIIYNCVSCLIFCFSSFFLLI